MSAGERWMLAYEYEPGRSCVPVGLSVEVGRTLVVGREGELRLGVEVLNRGISRKAIEVTAAEDGWDINVLNLNGAMLHPWGQAPQRITGRQFLRWPRLAIRLLGGAKRQGPDTSDPAHHWLLLEADTATVTTQGPRAQPPTTTWTVSPEPPLPLSGPQEEAVRLVFNELLQWPPRLPAQPMQLDAAARRLGIGESAVRERLRHVHERAVRLGLHRRVGLTNPDYLYVLVQAGYLAPPAFAAYRRPPAWLR
ncbi:hypothetical protein CcI49_09400 [Frankia sp. CcI49]|uniref:hypothetical protein n=1 Tax=unclassified Frankia TaxID=2632575 RepID=UPI0006CA4B3B|nr:MULTISPECIES: hypothetical protein [unclassified Frankia]KPM50972.1 hypothetical protein ACG83_36525 [Frankia sp. R43]ONH60801.1 hypothetical protein CcI49_09400 [Frankia sp. CcI49]